MKLKLTNGCTYTIPHEVLKTCKHIQIAYSDLELNLDPCFRLEKRNHIFKRNESFLKDYNYIGLEKFRSGDLNIELHWFIWKVDLSRCRCDVG
jgi:hypothetical protein